MNGYAQEVSADVTRERDRQNEKWGEQNHRNGTGDLFTPPFELKQSWTYQNLATIVRRKVDGVASSGNPLWSHILLEEVFEALSEECSEPLYDELVQVAAVAQQWAEAILRAKDL